MQQPPNQCCVCVLHGRKAVLNCRSLLSKSTHCFMCGPISVTLPVSVKDFRLTSYSPTDCSPLSPDPNSTSTQSTSLDCVGVLERVLTRPFAFPSRDRIDDTLNDGCGLTPTNNDQEFCFLSASLSPTACPFPWHGTSHTPHAQRVGVGDHTALQFHYHLVQMVRIKISCSVTTDKHLPRIRN